MTTLFATTVFALQVPDKPQSYVNDYANLLFDTARGQLEQTLAQFEKDTSNQIVVAIFPSLEDESLEDFSIHLAEKWKIGSKEHSNGAILLIFKDDRKMRIEVGYGLEGALPDLVCDQIIRREITPAFREGNFDAGVMNGIRAIMAATQGEYNVGAYGNTPLRGDEDKVQEAAPFIFLGVVFLVFILLKSFSLPGETISGRRGGRGSGGFYSGGFGGGGFSGGFGGGGGGGFGGGGASGRW